MATVPRSIKAFVLPADERAPPTWTTLPAVKEQSMLQPITPAEDPYLTPDVREAFMEKWQWYAAFTATNHMVARWKGYPQPNISRLPKISREHWPKEAWERRRAAFGTHKLHLFVTKHPQPGLELNPRVNRRVNGDAFILKLSDTVDENGRKIYVDLEPEDLDTHALREPYHVMYRNLEFLEEMFESLKAFE